ncbi:MAG: MTH1187 family thiamine-binding protein [Proteobacteria bacterium]|nr:MTH1187 family thiamine-binding protein [Pseudomonadota bacterium]MBU1716438.1 MTH1187 family thiamine-binding protein [Pseudomonadota bacterium]
MALMQLTIIPLGTGSPSVGEFVAHVQKALGKENVSLQLTDMGTIIEGDAKELLAIAAKLHEMPFQKGVQRVVTQISLDDRRDKKVRLGDKIDSISSRMRIKGE